MTEATPQTTEIVQLIRSIDDNPDSLHADITPSVLRLIELGLPAGKAVLDLLDTPNFTIRRHAQRVLEGVIMRYHGWKPGQGYPDPQQGEKQTRTLLEINGDYQADASPDKRRASIEKWKHWFAQIESNTSDREK